MNCSNLLCGQAAARADIKEVAGKCVRGWCVGVFFDANNQFKSLACS